MSLNHSEETHRNLVARVPRATGRELPEWFQALEAGPAFLRFDDRVRWLRDEHGRTKEPLRAGGAWQRTRQKSQYHQQLEHASHNSSSASGEPRAQRSCRFKRRLMSRSASDSGMGT